MKGKHLIGLHDLSREETELILKRGAKLKTEHKSGAARQSLSGKTVGMIFEKASTRTRVSFQVGAAQLGAHPVFLPGHELQLSRGEPVKDTARVLSGYVDAAVIRANRHSDVIEYAKWSDVPVINGLTDLLHPCQVLSDLFTIREAGLDLDQIKVAYVGDGNNMANSWINASSLFKIKLSLACPEGYDPDKTIMGRALKNGAHVDIVRDPGQAAAGAHVLYTDVWTSMGQEEEKQERKMAFVGYQINEELVAAAAPEAKVMHCLPAHRGEEITEEVMEGPHSIVFDQAENRLHLQKAILELVLLDRGGTHE